MPTPLLPHTPNPFSIPACTYVHTYTYKERYSYSYKIQTKIDLHFNHYDIVMLSTKVIVMYCNVYTI